MSETISFTAVSEVEIFDQTDESYDTGAEVKNPLWDRDDLTPLVSANANVLVLWQGAEMTLSDAISNYLAMNPVTEETQDIAIAVALELLANPRTKTEELAEESESEEAEPAETKEASQKSNAKSEVQKVSTNLKDADAQRQPKNQNNEPKYLEPPTIRAAAISQPEFSGVVAAKTEAAIRPLNSSADTAGPSAPETPLAINHATGSLAPESVIDRTAPELTVVAPSIKDQLTETKLAAKPEVEAKQPIPVFETPEADDDRQSPTSSRETEVVILPAAIKAVAELESIDPPPLDFERADVPDDTIEPSNKKFEVAQDQVALDPVDYQIGINGLTDFSEEAVRLGHFEEVGSEAAEETLIYQTANELTPLAQTEITSPEQSIPIGLPVGEIENSLIELGQRIEASGPEATEKLNDILDKIIEVPTKLRAENIITEDQAQEELEELFTELLCLAGIDYTPELIESLACISLEQHAADALEQLKAKPEADKTQQSIGTHEIITKPLAGSGNLKNAMTHASVIGKSALRLCVINLRPTRAKYLTS